MCGVLVASFGLAGCSGDTLQPYQTVTTKSGHEFEFVRRDDAKTISISIAWPSNAMFTADFNPVLPHVATQLLVAGGTKNIAAADVLAKFADLNSRASLSSQPGYIRGALSVKPENLLDVVTLSNQILVEPAFDPKWLERTKQNLITRVREMENRADIKSWTVARRILFGEQPIETYWSTPVDTLESIESADVHQWHTNNFGTSQAIIAVSGPKYDESISEAIDTLLAGLPQSTPQPAIGNVAFNVPAKTIIVVDPKAENAQVLILGEIPNSKTNQDIEALIALKILGQSPSSRLINVVRNEQRAAYTFAAGMFDFVREHRLMLLTGAIDIKDLDETLEKIEETYEDFRANGLTETEFTDAQERLSKSMTKNLENPAIVSNAMVEAKIDGLDISTLLEMSERTLAITLEQQNNYVLSGFPSFASMLKIIVLPEPSAIDADCVVDGPTELAGCSL